VQIRQHSINSSPRRVEYWINKGYSPEDAIRQVSNTQSITSLTAFISRHGEEEGRFRYEQMVYGKQLSSVRSHIHWVELGYSEEDARKIVSRVQSEFSKLQPKATAYWVNRGYSESDAIFKAKEFGRKLSMWCVEYWVDRGYSIEHASSKVREIQRENSLKGLLSYKRGGKMPSSNLQESVIRYIVDRGISIDTDYVINDTELKRVYFPDIVLSNCIIEIYGDYWHGNPAIYSKDDIISCGVRCSDKWNDDATRISRISHLTNKPVYVWWESEILENGIENMLNNTNQILREHK
jgi:hypothetical protein